MSNSDPDVLAEMTEPSWDEQHNDPRADIILVSKDNVSFRVNSWYLKQKSTFIQDLTALPSSQSFRTAPIPIDQLSRHVRMFIDLVYSSNLATPTIGMDDYKPLLDISDHLQAPSLQSTIWRGFRKSIKVNKSASYLLLWELFKMAAREDDNMTCNDIIMAFYHKCLHYDDTCSRPAEFYRGIPSRYLATLLTGNFRWSHSHAGDPAYRVKSFLSVAQRFADMNQGDRDLDLKIGEGRP